MAFLRQLRITRRREILENEMLSIHCCSVMWQVVAVAHCLALRRASGVYEHYTEHLRDVALEAADKLFGIHQWLKVQSKELASPSAATGVFE
jgi:hypothetical protein